MCPLLVQPHWVFGCPWDMKGDVIPRPKDPHRAAGGGAGGVESRLTQLSFI